MSLSSEEPRIGVFVCHCGLNIAGVVDVKKVVEEAKRLPHVVHAEDYIYMCSAPGQELIKKAILEKKLNAVVVAACTPTMHYETFARAIEAVGLNRYRLEMAVIREFSSWVHADKKKATEKAIKLVKAAVVKVADNSPLEPVKSRTVRKALVIGGGIAGITVALDLANAGIPVILVEKTPTIGGKMAMLSETFPTLDCAQCILTPKMAEVARHPLIKIYTNSEVVDVSGFVGNFKVKILQRARYVKIGDCRLCGFCERVCPVKVPSEFNRGLSDRKAIYIPFPQAIPPAYVIDKANCRHWVDGCDKCLRVCPTKAIDFNDEDKLVEEEVGVVIVATGYDLYPAERLKEYGYGLYRDVIDSLQFERILSAGGPTKGLILRPSDRKPVKRVVFIQCVGSRDINHLEYCSKICCMYTAKHALIFKERVPGGEAYVFYIDIRAAGKGYEEFIKRVQEEFQVNYIRGRVNRVYRDPKTGDMVVVGFDTLTGQLLTVKADLVVLATGLVPQLPYELASKLKIPFDKYGFVQEAHPKLRPVETVTSGVFVCGVAHGPKDIAETVAQASAAAAKAMELLYSEYIVKEPLVAVIDRDLCSGCRVCIGICPYGALELVEGKAKVNELLCEGCGACVVACPSRAIELRNYSTKQLLEMVKAVVK
jgi:heterodisulfide reductase subunit A